MRILLVGAGGFIGRHLQGVGKNLVLLPVGLWLLWLQPAHGRSAP